MGEGSVRVPSVAVVVGVEAHPSPPVASTAVEVMVMMVLATTTMVIQGTTRQTAEANVGGTISTVARLSGLVGCERTNHDAVASVTNPVGVTDQTSGRPANLVAVTETLNDDALGHSVPATATLRPSNPSAPHDARLVQEFGTVRAPITTAHPGSARQANSGSNQDSADTGNTRVRAITRSKTTRKTSLTTFIMNMTAAGLPVMPRINNSTPFTKLHADIVTNKIRMQTARERLGTARHLPGGGGITGSSGQGPANRNDDGNKYQSKQLPNTAKWNSTATGTTAIAGSTLPIGITNWCSMVYEVSCSHPASSA